MYKQYYCLVKYLKNNLPVSYPVRVRRLKIRKDCHADCQFKKKFFLIRISKDLKEEAAIDALIHEYSHVLSWGREEDIHGPIWGKSYSKVYNKFLEWLES